jgi:hypothetical protein
MRRLAIALLLMATACGQPQGQAGTSPVAEPPTPSATATAAVSPSPMPQPSTSKSLLFAVLEAKGTANAYTWNTVAIAGLDGYARATSTFIPMPVPTLGCIGAVLSPSAHVAAGKVYFADGKGVVRSLSIQGQIRQVATFSLTSSQQMLSFAVSPDGSRLLGTVFTLPAKPNLACNGSPAPGYALDVYSALAGGPSTLLYHQSLQASPSNVMALTGWDAVGPIGTSPTVWASQGGGPGSDLGVAVRIDAGTGRVLKQVSDPSACRVWDIGASGDFTCAPDTVAKVSVRRPDGSEIWHSAMAGYGYFLAPDEKHVLACCVEVTGAFSPLSLGRDGSRVKLAAGFSPEGWLDANTTVGESHPDPLQQPPFPLSYVGLSAPGTVVSMGFSGLFVGTVQS